MKAGAIPYWHCGGEVLTGSLRPDGRLAARPVGADEAQRLLAFYGDGPQGAALEAARAAAHAWGRAGRPAYA